MVDASEIWAAAATVLGDVQSVVSLLVGIGILFVVGDWILGREAPDVSAGGGQGSGLLGRRRRRKKGKNLGPLSKSGDYYTTDSWSDLEDNARKVNDWDG